MAPSDRSLRWRWRLALGLSIAFALPLVVACNSILGLSDFEKGECPGARCADDGGFIDQLVDSGPTVDGGEDASVDVKGTDPVSWAKWPMPNYGEGGAGEPPRPPQLTLTGEIVTDGITGLVWRSTLLPASVPVLEVETECSKLPNGPWRAPKRIELVTLLDYGRSSAPYIDGSKFKGIVNDKVWSTSPVRPVTAGKVNQPYWVVSFETGAVEALRGDFKASVLCVRAK